MNMQHISDSLVDNWGEFCFIVVLCIFGGIIRHITDSHTFALMMTIMLYGSIKLLMVMLTSGLR